MVHFKKIFKAFWPVSDAGFAGQYVTQLSVLSRWNARCVSFLAMQNPPVHHSTEVLRERGDSMQRRAAKQLKRGRTGEFGLEGICWKSSFSSLFFSQIFFGWNLLTNYFLSIWHVFMTHLNHRKEVGRNIEHDFDTGDSVRLQTPSAIEMFKKIKS